MSEFSGELRRLLGDRGMSMREAGRRVPCDAGYVSKLASGVKQPSPEMAERLDEVLEAGGTLAALVPRSSQVSDGQVPFPPLLGIPSPGKHRGRPALTVDAAEAVLARLYRIDAEMGGNELCAVVTGYLRDAARMFGRSLSLADADRLHEVMGGLTQMAGWLSIDASRHAEARRYLTAAIYAAHEAGDLGLAGHAIGYLSLSALYRNRHREALSLAETAADLTRGHPRPRGPWSARVSPGPWPGKDQATSAGGSLTLPRQTSRAGPAQSRNGAATSTGSSWQRSTARASLT